MQPRHSTPAKELVTFPALQVNAESGLSTDLPFLHDPSERALLATLAVNNLTFQTTTGGFKPQNLLANGMKRPMHPLPEGKVVKVAFGTCDYKGHLRHPGPVLPITMPVIWAFVPGNPSRARLFEPFAVHAKMHEGEAQSRNLEVGIPGVFISLVIGTIIWREAKF